MWLEVLTVIRASSTLPLDPRGQTCERRHPLHLDCNMVDGHKLEPQEDMKDTSLAILRGKKCTCVQLDVEETDTRVT